MKKIIVLLFSCMFILACEGKKKEVMNNEGAQKSALILYYSQTGATASVADQIKNCMNADIEEIICTNPYDGDFNATIERCKNERSKGEIPAIEPIKSDIQKYDIIFLGYPIWFGTYAPPISSLLEKVNFEGKKIVPFCTFGSGGLESSIKDLKSKLPKSDIKDGFGIRNARLKYMQEELDDFLKRNGYVQGEVEELPDFEPQKEMTESDKSVYHQACDDYPFPMGTPTSVSKRSTSKGTEYCFITQNPGNAPEGTSTVYVVLRNEKDAKAEFTKVVR